MWYTQHWSLGAGMDKWYSIHRHTDTQPRRGSVNELHVYSLALSTGKGWEQ